MVNSFILRTLLHLMLNAAQMLIGLVLIGLVDQSHVMVENLL